MDECLDKVSDIRLVGIAKVNSINTEINTGRVNEVGVLL